jgi:hypothetical protein
MPPSGPHRSRRFRRWFGVLAVLAILLRALIPAGFMIGQVDGHASWVVCAPGLERAAHHHAADPPLMAGMDHGGGTNPASGIDHAAHAAAHCPFALAAGAGLLAQAPTPADAYFVQLRPPPAAVVHSIPAAPPWRHHAPRGPPTLA